MELRLSSGLERNILESLHLQCDTLQKQMSSTKKTGNCWQGPTIQPNSYGPQQGRNFRQAPDLGQEASC